MKKIEVAHFINLEFIYLLNLFLTYFLLVKLFILVCSFVCSFVQFLISIMLLLWKHVTIPSVLSAFVMCSSSCDIFQELSPGEGLE